MTCGVLEEPSHGVLVLTPQGVAWRMDSRLAPEARLRALQHIRRQERVWARIEAALNAERKRQRRGLRRWLERRKLELLRLLGRA